MAVRRASSSLSSMTDSAYFQENSSKIFNAEPVSSSENVPISKQQSPSMLANGAAASKRELEITKLHERLNAWTLTQRTNRTRDARRFFSMDDIDQLVGVIAPPKTRGRMLSSSYCCSSSSLSASSTNISPFTRTAPFSFCNFPLDPPYPPPPPRRPTPPGIPSFGSAEAMQMRGMPPRPSRHRSLLFLPSSREPTSTGSSRFAIPWYSNLSQRNLANQPRGSTGTITLPESSSLPYGVIALAPDGTYVRGRFGGRTSGHGVGGGGQRWRGIEGHAFHTLGTNTGHLEEKEVARAGSSSVIGPDIRTQMRESAVEAAGAATSQAQNGIGQEENASQAVRPSTNLPADPISTNDQAQTQVHPQAQPQRTGQREQQQETTHSQEIESEPQPQPWWKRLWIYCCSEELDEEELRERENQRQQRRMERQRHRQMLRQRQAYEQNMASYSYSSSSSQYPYPYRYTTPHPYPYMTMEQQQLQRQGPRSTGGRYYY